MTAPASFRVIHAAENIKGGVGTYLRDLVVAQRASFGDGVVTLVVPRSQSDILESPAGVEVITFDDRGPRWRSTLRLAACMRDVMMRINASDVASQPIVHLHSTFAGLALRPLLRWAPSLRRSSMPGLRAPVVVYCAHGWSFDRETSAASRHLAVALERVLAPLCDAVVCISEHEMRIAREARIAPRTMVHISNGIPRHSQDAAANVTT
jgi:Glycosyltransferase Family 4